MRADAQGPAGGPEVRPTHAWALPLGRRRLADHSAVLVTENEERESLDLVHLVGAERRVVEAAAGVRVAVFVEADLAAAQTPVHLHVDPGQRLAGLLLGHAELAQALDGLDEERVRVIRLR